MRLLLQLDNTTVFGSQQQFFIRNTKITPKGGVWNMVYVVFVHVLASSSVRPIDPLPPPISLVSPLFLFSSSPYLPRTCAFTSSRLSRLRIFHHTIPRLRIHSSHPVYSYVGSDGAPPSHCGNANQATPVTTVEKTPVIAEKPFITVDKVGKFYISVPPVKMDSVGPLFVDPKTTKIPFESVYLALPSDSAAAINAKLAAGLNVVLTPGIYSLDAPLLVTKAGQVLLGVGWCVCACVVIPSVRTCVLFWN